MAHGTCQYCGRKLSRPDYTRCMSCAAQRRKRDQLATPPPFPTLRSYPTQPAIIGATCQPDWQRAVDWESRPQRWTTLRPAERRSL